MCSFQVLTQKRFGWMDFNVKGQNFKEKGQKIKMTLQCTNCIFRLSCPENMKQLSFIVSEQ